MRTGRALVSVPVAALLTLLAPPADARDLRFEPWIDLPVTIGLGAFGAGVQIFQADLVSDDCRWCASNGLDDGVRGALRADDPTVAVLASDVLVGAVVPIAALGGLALAASRADRWAELSVDAAILAEAAFAAVATVQIVKLLAARERPFVHTLPDDEKDETETPSENDVSFYSGHTTFAFAMVVAATTIASMRGRDLAPWIAIVGLPLAALAGTLRIVGDRHWATDVIFGAAMGSTVGFGVPWLHR